MYLDDLDDFIPPTDILEILVDSVPEFMPVWSRVVFRFEDSTMLVEIDKSNLDFQSVAKEFSEMQKSHKLMGFKDCEDLGVFNYLHIFKSLGFNIPKEYEGMIITP